MMSREVLAVTMCLLTFQLLLMPAKEKVISEQANGINWQGSITSVTVPHKEFESIALYTTLEKANHYLLDHKVTIDKGHVNYSLHKTTF